MIYAQIDSGKVCIGISQLNGEVQSDNMILIDTYDSALLGKKYENTVWTELSSISEPVLTPTPVEPTNAQVLQGINNLIADLTIAGVI